jgi:hypothetical protein
VGLYIRIKTYSLLLAWLVIFAHGVIPHHHSDDNCGQITDCCQSDSPSGIDLSKAVMLIDHPSEVKVCHLSNLLFQNFNPENLHPFISSQPIFIPICISGKIYISSTVSIISPHSYSTVGFRAPPVA